MANGKLTGPALEAVFGCMFSGKTEELIKRRKHLSHAKLLGQTFLPEQDVRRTRSLETAFPDTVRIRRLAELVAFSREHPEVQVLLVDEFQFFLEETLEEVCEMVDNVVTIDRKRLVIAGLDTNYLGRPFGPMPWIIAMATDRSPQFAVCSRCGQYNATRSRRKTASNAQVVVGDDYEALCISCFGRPTT